MSDVPPSPDNPEYQGPADPAEQPVPPPPYPQAGYPPQPYPTGNDPIEGMIPYKNPPALIAYYLGVFSFVVPFMGIASIVTGFIGLSKHKENPLVRGKGHSITGIILGVLTVIGWGALCAGIMNIFRF